MVRLNLEENGKRRAFRVGEGVLKIGSGESATLRLTGEGVADLHAILEVVGDHAKLRVEAGAEPPTIDGETVLGEVELRQGQGLQLGGALIWIEDESVEAGSGRPGGAASAAAPKPAVGARPRSSQKRKPAATGSASREASRNRAMQQARTRESRSQVQRSRPRVEKGLPTGAILGIVAAVLLVGFFAARKAFKVSAENTTDTQSLLRGVAESISEALYTKAESKLSIINLDNTTPDQRKLIEQYKKQIAEGYEKQQQKSYYSKGNKWFDVYLSKYESKYLQGNPQKSRIRLFLKRCREFRERWPEHEELEWVSRQEQRFRGAVNLSEPPTFDDIDWEIQFILGGTPRRYEIALDLIDDYLARTDTSDLDREAAQARRREIEAERPEQFEEAMKWARHEYENGDDMKAVHWLVFAVAYMEDPAMEDKAADYLMEMPNLKGHLEAYQRDHPDVFAELMENGTTRAKAIEFGIL